MCKEREIDKISKNKNKNKNNIDNKRLSIVDMTSSQWIIQSRGIIFYKLLKLHEEALAIDDVFEIDEAFENQEHAVYSIVNELHLHDAAINQKIHHDQENYHETMRLHEQFVQKNLKM